jgi:acetolactate synthase-1/2/3 large subunit
VTTIICKNDAYRILDVERATQGLGNGGSQSKRLTDLSGPSIDWVSLARGYGVAGVSVKTAVDLRMALAESFRTPGPFLIEACIQ